MPANRITGNIWKNTIMTEKRPSSGRAAAYFYLSAVCLWDLFDPSGLYRKGRDGIISKQKDTVSTSDSMCAERTKLWYNIETKGHCFDF